MDVHGEERPDVVQRGDAAGGGDFERGGGAQAAEPIEVGALHHAFLVDIGAEEAGAVGLERREHFFGGEVGGFLPAFDHDAAAFGIERDDQALAAHGVAQGGEKLVIDAGLA